MLLALLNLFSQDFVHHIALKLLFFVCLMTLMTWFINIIFGSTLSWLIYISDNVLYHCTMI